MGTLPVSTNPKPSIIYNAIRTPDGTVISSRHRHDFVAHEDANGTRYFVDGGLDYLRRGGQFDYEELSLYDDEPHEIQRQVIVWGTYGKDGKQPLTYKPVADMESEHIRAVLDECHPRFVIRTCLLAELAFRGAG